MKDLKTNDKVTANKKSVLVEYIFVEYLPSTLKEDVIYVVRDNFAAHNCLCGCMRKIVLPLCKMGWALTEKNGKLSLLPSVKNLQIDCRSHYVITNSVANFI